MRPVFSLLISVGLATLGQIFLKKGVLQIGELTFKNSIASELIKLILNPILYSGLIFYMISTILMAHSAL